MRTENITLSKVLVLDLLRRAKPGAYLAEREKLLRTIVELRRELAEVHNADLLAAAEALLDRLDTMTTEEFRHGGEREQRESLHAEVQKSKLEASK